MSDQAMQQIAGRFLDLIRLVERPHAMQLLVELLKLAQATGERIGLANARAMMREEILRELGPRPTQLKH